MSRKRNGVVAGAVLLSMCTAGVAAFADSPAAAQSNNATGATVSPFQVAQYVPVRMNFGRMSGRGTLIIDWNENKDYGLHDIPRVTTEVPVATVSIVGGGEHTIQVPVLSQFVHWSQNGIAELELVSRFGDDVAVSAIPVRVRPAKLAGKIALLPNLGIAGTAAGIASTSFSHYRQSNSSLRGAVEQSQWVDETSSQRSSADGSAVTTTADTSSTAGTTTDEDTSTEPATTTIGTRTSPVGTVASVTTTGTSATVPDRPPPICVWRNDTPPREITARVGELHIVGIRGAKGQFEYTDNVDSTFGIAWSFNADSGYYESGTIGVNNNVGSGGSVNASDGYRWYINGNYWAQNKDAIGGGCAGPTHQEDMISAVGDAFRGTRQPPPKRWRSCHTAPTGYAKMNPAGAWWNDHGHAIEYGAGLNLWGIGISAQTGYTNTVQIKYWDQTGISLWVCGNKGRMPNVPVLYESSN